jgi:uncharacterized protein
MSKGTVTIIDLARLSLSSGEGIRLDLPVPLEEIEIAGQAYGLREEAVEARLDVSRLSQGYAFRLSFPLGVEGPCMRCLEGAEVSTTVEAREVDQAETDDEELRSPYVEDDRLEVGRWARDASLLALPTQILCRPDCAGLCPVCGESLNGADPADHEHEQEGDPRWAKLRDLNLE